MVLARRRAASPPWMLDRPVHGADGRLTNHHGLPFEHQRNLLVYMVTTTVKL